MVEVHKKPGAAEYAWAQEIELAKIERDLRETLAGTSSAELQEALRRATSSMNAGIDRDLLRQARRQLPVLLAREDLLACIESSGSTEIQALEAALQRASSLRIDAEILTQARQRLDNLRFAWLPLSTVTSTALGASCCRCDDCQGARGFPGDTGGTLSEPSPCGVDGCHHVGVEGQAECSICLETYREGDTTAALPCSHSFHAACAKQWLSLRPECPTCRATIELYPQVGMDT